jgi:hypothetical protein
MQTDKRALSVPEYSPSSVMALQGSALQGILSCPKARGANQVCPLLQKKPEMIDCRWSQGFSRVPADCSLLACINKQRE